MLPIMALVTPVVMTFFHLSSPFANAASTKCKSPHEFTKSAYQSTYECCKRADDDQDYSGVTCKGEETQDAA